MMAIAKDTVKLRPGKIHLGTVSGPQGLQGAVRIKSYTARPEDIASYGPLTDNTGGREYFLRILRLNKKGIIGKLSGITDRAAAEEVKGLDLYVPRDALPETDEEEFYYSDLIGMKVEDEEGKIVGQVRTMNNFGAGDVMEVVFLNNETLVLPFTRDVVPTIDLALGKVQISRPMEINATAKPIELAGREEDAGS